MFSLGFYHLFLRDRENRNRLTQIMLLKSLLQVGTCHRPCRSPHETRGVPSCWRGGAELRGPLPQGALGRAQAVLSLLCLHPLFLGVFQPPSSDTVTLPALFFDACRSLWASSAATCSRHFPAPSWTGCSPQPSWRIPRSVSLSWRFSSASSIATGTGRSSPPSGMSQGFPNTAGDLQNRLGREICWAGSAGRIN